MILLTQKVSCDLCAGFEGLDSTCSSHFSFPSLAQTHSSSMPTRQSARQSISFFVYLSFYSPLSICLSVCLFDYLYLTVSLPLTSPFCRSFRSLRFFPILSFSFLSRHLVFVVYLSQCCPFPFSFPASCFIFMLFIYYFFLHQVFIFW